MYRLGVTGGIGSGKSQAAQFFSEKGAVIFDADEESKKRLSSSISLQHKLINAFGNEVTTNGKLILSKLAEVAFSDSFNQRILNGIMWPEIMILIDQAAASAEDSGISLFVVDAALIFEANIQNLLDSVLLITAKKDLRLKRAVTRRNLPASQIQKRMLLQMDDEEKKKLADFIIENIGSLDDLRDEVENVYKKLKL